MKGLPRQCTALLLVMLMLLTSGCGASVDTVTSPCKEKTTRLAVIMYHGLTEKQERRNRYVISYDCFEDDLKYLSENGYTAILPSELADCFEKGKPLPEKPVMLSFDDGYLNNYTLGFPLLKKYGAKALISPIGIAADNAENEKYRSPDWSQCKWSELKEMADSGLVEIGSHTYDLHKISGGKNGAAKMSGETDEEYEKRLRADILTANESIEKNIGKKPCTFVYPFGAKSESTEEIIRSMGFTVIMDCENKLNTPCSGEDLYRLHRFLRPDGISAHDFFTGKVFSAANDKQGS